MPYELVIIGAGPGGLAPLFAAARAGKLSDLLAGGLLVLEKSNTISAGGLAKYNIASDSPAEAFLDCVANSAELELRELLTHPAAQRLEALRGKTVPLALASEFVELAAKRLCSIVERSPGCSVLLGWEAVSVRRRSNRLWEIRTRDLETNEERCVQTRSVHMATGGHQPLDRLRFETVGSAPLLPRFAGKLMQSGELFTATEAGRFAERLRGRPDPRVAIVGSSTSAGAAAVYLLRQSSIAFSADAITLLHRSPLRLFYASAEEARADGYFDFQPSDVCHLSGRVFRLSGFRFEAKDVFRSSLQLQGRTGDPRLKLIPLGANAAAAEIALQQADMIIAAMGYRPRMCPVLDEEARPIPLHEPVSGDWAMVDQRCRVLTCDKQPLPGLTAMGLSIGPAASYELGGEAKYRGQVNSLWLWQNTLGLRVVDEVLKRTADQTMPLMRPSPPTLSTHTEELRAIEDSNVYSNFGPVNTRLEQDIVDSVFDGVGHCVTTCNATLALMLAIRDAVGDVSPGKRYALMPSFTFAATAQAALWCGLTPLYCDIDPATWLPSQDSEEELLQTYAETIAVIVPYATFGNNLDLQRYERISQRTGIPVVVDAASSLGSIDRRGAGFGKGSTSPIVFSMHATKTFATGEGGLLYCADPRTVERLRAMSSFGFGENRVATMPGLNAKMSEVAALTAALQLKAFPKVMSQRDEIARAYAMELGDRVEQQVLCGRRQARPFQSILLSARHAPVRKQIMQTLRHKGVITGCYFSPHLAQQPFLRDRSVCPPLPATEDVASRILTLPMFEGMTASDVAEVAERLFTTLDGLQV